MMLPLLLMLLIVTAAPAGAQTVYRWVDERGAVHYAQSLEAVPERYRSQITTREFAPSAPPPAPAAPAAPAPGGPAKAPAAPARPPAAGEAKPAEK